MASTTQEKQEKVEEVQGEVVEDVVDILEPKSDPRTWVLSDGEVEREYVQKSLSYFAKIQFFGLVGDTLDRAMSDDNLTVGSVIGENLTVSDMSSVDNFMSMVAKIARYAPDFLKDCYCIWLAVPAEERVWAKYAMDHLTDDEGIEIIEVFIDQNWEAIEGFFNEKVQKIMRRFQKARENGASPSSKPSKPTQRTTRSRSKNS